MTWRKRTIMEMAREAQMRTGEITYVDKLERFAELVREDEVEKYKWDVHSCGPTCTKVACVAVREAVQAEREACAATAEQVGQHKNHIGIAAAIRARGQA